ncbi:hypothetical protein J2W17_002707 [Pseudomonas lini]|nr:hypothetical protein [Pseudomonas lini]
MSVSTGSYGRCLPEVEFQIVGKIADLGQKLTAFTAIFDGAAKFHAALVFLLTTGSDGAVAFFVGLGHFESPKAMTGVTGWARGMTVWRRVGYRDVNLRRF